MPSGVYDRHKTTKFHCRRCPATFKTMPQMRKHQWHAHPETYAKLSQKTAERASSATTEITVREFIDVPTGAGVLNANGNKNMTVTQLLATLKRKETFLADVIELIDGIQSAHTEAAHHE